MKCKSGKAAGEDGISYEFFVNLNAFNRSRLLECLNGVLRSEAIPESWSSLKMFLLFKKGDAALVANYRGISLLNCFAKLFTLKCLFYADDLVLLARNKSQLQQALHCLEKFCDENLLTVNTEKTKVVIFRRSVRFTVSTSCPCCVTGSLDTIEHFVSECPRFGANRQLAGLLPLPLAELFPGNGLVLKAMLKFIKISWPQLLLRNDRLLN